MSSPMDKPTLTTTSIWLLANTNPYTCINTKIKFYKFLCIVHWYLNNFIFLQIHVFNVLLLYHHKPINSINSIDSKINFFTKTPQYSTQLLMLFSPSYL